MATMPPLTDTDTYGDLVKDGVIDPAKVTRIALQNAWSIAGLMLTTEALIAEIPEQEKTPASPHAGGMGGGMYWPDFGNWGKRLCNGLRLGSDASGEFRLTQ